MAQIKQHRQLLMQCAVINAGGVRTTRYVDHNIFELWTFMMQLRHGLQVQDARPCVWVPREQSATQLAYMQTQTDIFDVIRLEIDTFNTTSHQTRHHVRFAPNACAEFVGARLRRHLGGDTTQTDICMVPGTVITQPVRAETDAPIQSAPNCSMPRGLAPARSAIRS